MNPPIVYELTMPNSQRIISKTAIVQSIGTPFVDVRVSFYPATQRSVRRLCCVEYPAKALSGAQSRLSWADCAIDNVGLGVLVNLDDAVPYGVEREICNRMQV